MNSFNRKIGGFALAILVTQLFLTLPAFSQSAASVKKKDFDSEVQWAYSVGLQNYIFGLPLIVMERERTLRLNPAELERQKGIAPAAPINQVGHMKDLANADTLMPYSPNNDSVYSGAILELVDEPIILTTPDILDRYWSVEVVDSYTNNIHYIGTRATGGKGGNFAFVGPNWQGTLPDDVLEYRMPTNTTMLAIRIGVIPENAADLKKVNELQQMLQLTSLSNWGNPANFGKADIPDLLPRPSYKGDLAFFYLLADLVAENPPPADHEQAYWLLSQTGIEVGKPFDENRLSEATKKGLRLAAKKGPEIIDWKSKSRGTPYPSQWNNLTPGDYGFDYLNRASGAQQGLVVHSIEEATYFFTYKDKDGNFFDGKNNYVLHFDKGQFPPVLKNGFWSVTMYGSGTSLVKNPINRFSIGDRTQGLKYNADGSLDIYIQNKPPADELISNWLPCPPKGIFRLLCRIYLPSEEMQNPATLGNYLPLVEKF